jgi:release factor glutamine methyltransferase
VNIENILKEAIEILQKNSVASPILDARLLLSFATSLSKEDIIFNAQQINLSENQIKKYFELIHKRAKKIPLTHLTNNREFFANNFYVDENVLDPRPDSEALIEMAIKEFEKISFLEICEIGCGSGCLIISLLKYFENWRGLAIDISNKALVIAKKNADTNQVLTRINFLESNLFNNFKGDQIFDIIISNPPYIPTNDIENLQDEVRLYEPRIALDGGFDGLDFYRKIAEQSQKFLKNNGDIFLEIGYNQYQDVKKIFENNNFKFIDFKKDLSGIIRVLQFKKTRNLCRI